MTRTLSAALITLGDPGRLTGGYLYHRRLAELAAQHAARLDFVSFADRPFPLAIADAPAVMAAVRRTGAEVIVLDSIAAAFCGPWLALRAPPRPMLGMLHQPPGGIDHGPLRASVQARLDRLAYRRVARLLVASDSLADELRRAGEPADRLRVVPPGRDVAAAAGPPPGDPRSAVLPGARLRQGRRAALLCVGNWLERKGIVPLLDAFASLDDQVATLHLVGDTLADTPYAQRVRTRLAQPALRRRVIVHGPLPRGDVAALYAAADAFVLPSLKEPYGTVYGEAMAFGLPVIGWRAGNLPYLAEHDREGLLVQPGDLRGLAATMQRVADDADLRRRLGAAARQRALSRPTWDEVASLFFEHLRDVADRAHARSPE